MRRGADGYGDDAASGVGIAAVGDAGWSNNGTGGNTDGGVPAGHCKISGIFDAEKCGVLQAAYRGSTSGDSAAAGVVRRSGTAVAIDVGGWNIGNPLRDEVSYTADSSGRAAHRSKYFLCAD